MKIKKTFAIAYLGGVLGVKIIHLLLLFFICLKGEYKKWVQEKQKIWVWGRSVGVGRKI